MDLLGNEKRPLAERIRPTSLDDFVGQTHVLNRLQTMLSAPRLPSLLLFGPPGCGKSTLALILARVKGRPYVRVSAPEAGLATLRDLIKGKEILILDELHRFSKAQQDFFLPILETGEIILLATTTENPSFSVTRQLLSRLHVLRLRPLSHAELMSLAERGAREAGMTLARESLDAIALLSSGDGRTLLNLVEFVAALPEEKRAPDELRKQLPEALARGDRDGDTHYELASAMRPCSFSVGNATFPAATSSARGVSGSTVSP